MFDYKNLISLISYVFYIYIIYKFFSVFFDRRLVNKKFEVVSYILFYMAVSLAFLFFDNPIINLLVNMLMISLLTLNYKAEIGVRAVAAICIFSFAVFSEGAVISVLREIGIVRNPVDSFTIYEYATGQISSYIVLFLLTLLFSNFRSLRHNIEVSFSYWVATVCVPLLTLIPAIFIINNTDNNLYTMIFTIIILFAVNMLVFYLYDNMQKSEMEKRDSELISLQNKATMKQIEILKKSQNDMRIFKHDSINHINALKNLIKKGDCISALTYIDDTYDVISSDAVYSETGNNEIDSIINYKIYESMSQGIEVKFRADIPKALNISSFDLTAIVGNLFDNAIEATGSLEEEKVIDFSMQFENGIIYIKMENPYSGVLITKGQRLVTRKNCKNSHGIGLISVDKTLEKYNGVSNINYEHNKFCINLLIYNIKPHEEKV